MKILRGARHTRWRKFTRQHRKHSSTQKISPFT